MNDQLKDVYEGFARGEVSRRDFMRQATVLGAAGAAAAALGSLVANPAEAAGLAQQGASAAAAGLPLDVAEWSYMWVNVHRADTARGSFIGGQQMYVEYMIPARVRHQIPIVLVHGGGGQGLDWMGTPDGRPGWFQMLVDQGYKVYVVDRPGHGRSPLHPDTHGGFPAQAGTLENISGRFTPPNKTMRGMPGPFQHLHNQWVGEGTVGSENLDQFVASQGGSYVVQPPVPGAPPPPNPFAGGGNQGPANQQPAGPPNVQHMAWREAGADLLDKIGPAVIVTHSAGGPFGLLVAEARPNLVRATVMIEGGGQPFAGGNRWGMSSIPVTYDPPVSDPSEIRVRRVDSPEMGVNAYYLQDEPARKLPNLKNVKVVVVTAEGSFASPGNPGAVAFLKQAGVQAEELRLVTLGITGNGHMMMVERNNREVLKAITDWMDKNVSGSAPAVKKRGTDSTALRLAKYSFFWSGTEHKTMPYGTILQGQTYVQEMIPEVVRQPVPIVLVHGGGGSMLHYMGLDGNAGWVHYYLQNGYKVYLIDRPGHGRAPYHPDALGPIGNLPMHAGIAADFRRAATGRPRRWPGSGEVGDPSIDQFQAGQNAALQDNQLAQQLWRKGGADLLERIGPAIIQTHSAGGPFGWVVADERPQLVKAVVSFEGAAAPVLAQGSQPARTLNVKGIPMMYLTAENSGRTQGLAIVEALGKSGALAEAINLKDRGITGNGHFAMFETNRKEVFEVIRGWIESKFPAAGTPTTTSARG
jgi:pimeloyl-ACP methyl ester carboxylesterase